MHGCFLAVSLPIPYNKKMANLYINTVRSKIENLYISGGYACYRESRPKYPLIPLNGRHVIVLLGYSYGDWFDYITDPQNNITHESAIKHDQALRMLLSHRVDYLLDYQLPINLALANMETPKLYYHDVFSIEGHIVVSKKLPNAKQILRRLEDSYKSLQLNPVK